MKKTLIISGIVVFLIVIIGYIVISKFSSFGSIPSGGKLSANQASYDVKNYYIEVEIFPETKSIKGFTDIQFEVLNQMNIFEFDLIDQIKIDKIVLDQNELNFTRNDSKVFAESSTLQNIGDIKQVRIYYQGQPLEANRPPWDGGFNWSRTDKGDYWIGLSCQGEGSKVWMPSKDHPSDEPDSVDIRIIVDKDYFVASNGLLIETRDIADKKRYHWKSNYTTNNYNISINIAKYKTVSKTHISETDSFPIIYYTLNDDENAHNLVNQADDMITRISKYLGPYPFAKEKFGLVETDYLGMEHQTINSYGNRYRFNKYNGQDVDMLMLHEMAHEWFGNKITVSDWADFWIHEGMGSYVEALYILDLAGEEAYHNHVKTFKNRIRNVESIIPHRNATTTDSYRSDIYPKGAYLMHTLRFILGDEKFFDMLYQFCTNEEFTYSNFTSTDEFISHVSKFSDYKLKPYIDMFLNTTNLIEFEIQGESPNYKIRIKNLDFVYPVNVKLNNEIKRMVLSTNWVDVTSTDIPIIDEKRWYLKHDDM